MPKLKNPVMSFSGQGRLGDIYLSHHNGNTYAYGMPVKQPLVPTPRQQEIWENFGKGAEYWGLLTPEVIKVFEYLASRETPASRKDCKPPARTAYTRWMKTWLSEVPLATKVAGIAAIILWVIIHYAWVLVLF